MGVVLLETFSDDAGALGVLFVVLEAFAVHGGEDATMDGLESVADIGQGTADDDRHRVVEIRAAHLLFDVDGKDGGAALIGRGRWNGPAGGRLIGVDGEFGVLIVCHKVLWRAKGFCRG
jgi:hypothetical protein